MTALALNGDQILVPSLTKRLAFSKTLPCPLLSFLLSEKVEILIQLIILIVKLLHVINRKWESNQIALNLAHRKYTMNVGRKSHVFSADGVVSCSLYSIMQFIMTFFLMANN